MPMSIQNRTMSYIASCTLGFSKFRSGWWPKNRCQKYCRRMGSKVQLDVSVSTKMMRASAYRVSSSDQTYQSERSFVRESRLSWNHGC